VIGHSSFIVITESERKPDEAGRPTGSRRTQCPRRRRYRSGQFALLSGKTLSVTGESTGGRFSGRSAGGKRSGPAGRHPCAKRNCAARRGLRSAFVAASTQLPAGPTVRYRPCRAITWHTRVYLRRLG